MKKHIFKLGKFLIKISCTHKNKGVNYATKGVYQYCKDCGHIILK